jgi:Protein kinase domain
MLLPSRYANVRLLGEGSFARVYAADDLVLGCGVAVKVLREDLAGSEAAQRRFAREVHTAAALGGHPHVVTVHDAGSFRGLPYLVMELLEGSVADRRHDDVPRGLALRWLRQAASALDHVHAHGVVHRDVKPANLLLDERGDIRLADFGVARGETLGLTFTGAIVGSPGYLAPEVVAGRPATAASDIYSLAVAARELLGDDPALDAALAADPAERPSTAGALFEEPETVVSVRRGRRVARLAPTEVVRAMQPPRRHRAVRTSVVAAVIAVVAAGSAAGGALIAGRAAKASVRTPAAQHQLQRQTCALSTFDHDANVVVAGVAAARFCRVQAHTLRLDGYRWTYRAGKELIAPDHGRNALGVVCRLRRAGLAATVYDSGGRAIGAKVCDWYAAGPWRRA